MSLEYQGNKEKRDPKEFKKLLKDLESRRKKGVTPKKVDQENGLKNKEDPDTSVASANNKPLTSSDVDITPEEEEVQQEPKEKAKTNLPVTTKQESKLPSPDSRNKQIQELNAFKGDIHSEFNKQNKGISNIEDDLDRLEQKMFHSQGGEKTKRQDQANYEEPEETSGFNLKESYAKLDETLRKNDGLISGMIGGGLSLWHSLTGSNETPDSEDTNLEEIVNVPPAPYDPDYDRKMKLYVKQHPETQEAKNLQNTQKVENVEKKNLLVLINLLNLQNLLALLDLLKLYLL